MTADSQSERIARLKRTELLDGAIQELAEHGWRGVQMQAVAKRVGVSRQTMYYTFDNRDGLAAAMVTHLADGFLDGFDLAFATDGTVSERWQAGIHYLLRRGRDDRALHAMLAVGSGNRFLQLLTSDSAPILARARDRIPATAARYQPDLDRARLVQVAELLARLVLSQVVQPMTDLSAATGTVSEMISGYLAVAGGAANRATVLT